MSGTVPVFINERLVQLPVGATAADAVTALDAELGVRLGTGAAQVTDARGIALDPGVPVHAGMILRVQGSARRSRGDADAHS